jgi:outer membrane protein insertion porin family
MIKRLRVLAAFALLAGVKSVWAQELPAPAARLAPAQAAGAQDAPSRLPPPDSPPLVRVIELAFPTQGGASLIEPQTYLYYVKSRGSRPSEGVWVRYNEETVLEDFRSLWNTAFLDNLWIDVTDEPYENGVVGKHITYYMEERQKVKIVDYVGSKKIEVTKIDEKLKEANTQIRLDSFIDPGKVRKVEGIVRDMLREKGFQFANVTHAVKEVAGAPKLVHLTFNLDEGPKVRIRKITFVGNKAVGSRALKGKMKENKEQWFLSFISDRGTYKEGKYEEDADKVLEYYREEGYVTARVGQPELKSVGDSSDKKTRWIELRIPIVEGNRYKVGDFVFDGNKVVKAEFLKGLFKLKAGEYYSEKWIRKGLEKAREVYGAGGYFEFSGYPDLRPRDEPNQAEPDIPEALRADTPKPSGPPIVDVTMKIQEGQQYFVNRITFVGNTTTHDNVIRREIRLAENGVFNTEALKYSVKRLNQLGYFKPLEGGDNVNVEKTKDAANKVDVRLKLEEQNRNQLTFGAGVSQFEGFFGQLSFQTANFIGRGESLTVSVQAGSRAQNYQLAFTEPFLFDRNITGGFDLFKREIRYISQFTQKSSGMVLTFGFPLASFTRLFTSYSYERVAVTDLNTDLFTPQVGARNPYLADSLLIGQGGSRVISKVVPSFVHNTVDNPIFPTKGTRYTMAIDLAGLGGDTNFYKPFLEGVWYWRQNARFSLGTRAQYQYVHQFSGSKPLPITEKLYLGGEYSIRGFDIRMVSPMDPSTGLLLGGVKSLLFNVEQYITIAGPVRLILFYDMGQVQPGAWVVMPTTFISLDTPILPDFIPAKSFAWEDFKSSVGAEIRFMMPVLNVPFRLIFAYNPWGKGVLNNQMQPQKSFQFRFAVGSTF